MQMNLPLFPRQTKLINPSLGVRVNDGFVYYLHNGNPIGCHNEQDLQSYRYICGSLVSNGLCTATELAAALGVKARSIQRYGQKYAKEGAKGFFQPKTRKGTAHKLTPEKIEQASQMLGQDKSNYQIAKQLGVSEGTIRYHIKKGSLQGSSKKKPL